MQHKISPKDKIFVAGASGMVGSAIYKKLLFKGYGNKDLGGEIFAPNRKELNLLNIEEVKNWFSLNNPDVVILAAAKVGGILANSQNPFDFLNENLKIQTNIIETSWLNGTKRLLFLGSSCIYPKLAKQPISEEELLNGKLEKTNEGYAIAKISGIKLCEALRLQHGFDAISLMPTNLYGTGDNYDVQSSHVMASFIKKFSDAKFKNEDNITCWGSGKPEREFLHVEDLAEASIFCLEKWNPSDKNSPKDLKGEPLSFLNIGTGIDISIESLAEKIANLTDYKGRIIWDTSKPDGTPKKLLNISRIKTLGWEPKINLDEGIKRTIKEYQLKYLR